MTIINVFDAAREGDINEFKRLYKGDINIIDKYTKLNLLQMVLSEKGNYIQRLKIVHFLLKNGIDVNYVDRKDRMNALHLLYSSYVDDIDYIYKVTKKLIQYGINVNEKNKYGANPLEYLIAGKLDTEELKPLFKYLIKSGADYNAKDNYGNSCLDYAKQFSWRTGFVQMVEDIYE